jgi:gentisate 1,2-dioxygenase
MTELLLALCVGLAIGEGAYRQQLHLWQDRARRNTRLLETYVKRTADALVEAEAAKTMVISEHRRATVKLIDSGRGWAIVETWDGERHRLVAGDTLTVPRVVAS